uniref:Putative kazal domain protein n=1 Tax=Rhipicephalus microplus TaxID=6941 RepID=A0A6G5A4F9_RHIMP
MNIIAKYFVVFTLFFRSFDWLPTDNVLLVYAGRVVFGPKNCWRHDCFHGSCNNNAPTNCECPSVFEQFLESQTVDDKILLQPVLS